jgi:hypothetical protein
MVKFPDSNVNIQLHKTATFLTLKNHLKARLLPNHRLWFRLPDRSWSEVTGDATLPWNRLPAGSNVYTIQVREDSPPSSPEQKEPGEAPANVLRGTSLLSSTTPTLMQTRLRWPAIVTIVPTYL